MSKIDTARPNFRPNFKKALKNKKEFFVKVTPELLEELQKVASEYIYIFGQRPFKDVPLIFFKEGGKFDTLYTSWIIGPKPETEYFPATDTFKKPDAFPKGEDLFKELEKGNNQIDKDLSKTKNFFDIPEPVSIDEIVERLDVLSLYWYVRDSPFKIERIGIDRKITATKRYIILEDGRELDVNNLFFTFSDAVKVAENKGWK